MTASTLTQLPLMAGSALFATLSRAGSWTLARYMRAPLASTGLLAMVTLTALAGSNALYFQTARHPSPFFVPVSAGVAELPTPVIDRPDELSVRSVVPDPVEPTLPDISTQTTGSVSAPPAVIPDAPVGNSEMFAVQKKLFELQLFSGTIDGYYGPKTAEAIRAFETRNGMTPTGAMSDTVIQAILSSDAAGRVPQAAAAQPQPVATPAVEAAPVQVQQAAIGTPSPGIIPPQPLSQATAQSSAESPAVQALDRVAGSAASTIDSIIAAVDTSRTPPAVSANPPVPALPVAAVRSQPMPEPIETVEAAAPAAPARIEATPAVTTTEAGTTPRVPPANNTELVKQIQRGLASLGFYRAPVDGQPSAETARAIREFENFHRYRMTGQVQPDLVDLLVKAGATI